MLENLRRVAVREEAIGFEIFIHFDEMEIAAGVFACATGARLAIANDACAGSKQTCLCKRPQSQNHAGRVTAWIGNQTSLRNLAGIEFGNAVDSFRQPFGVRRGQFIPRGEGFRFAKAECSTQIDDPKTRAEQIGRQLRGDFVRGRKKRGARLA